MVNHLRKFLPHLADKTKPLRDLLIKKNMWTQQKAFEEIKTELTTPPVPELCNQERIASANASSYGLGVMLLQRQEDGHVKPIAYASRSLSTNEQRYTQIEKKALATMWACERFEFLIGTTFHIETNHKPLVFLLGFRNLDDLLPHIQQLRKRLMRFSNTISHVPGKNIMTADVLSRSPINSTLDQQKK